MENYIQIEIAKIESEIIEENKTKNELRREFKENISDTKLRISYLKGAQGALRTLLKDLQTQGE